MPSRRVVVVIGDGLSGGGFSDESESEIRIRLRLFAEIQYFSSEIQLKRGSENKIGKERESRGRRKNSASFSEPSSAD